MKNVYIVLDRLEITPPSTAAFFAMAMASMASSDKGYTVIFHFDAQMRI